MAKINSGNKNSNNKKKFNFNIKSINKRLVIIILLLIVTIVSGTFAWYTYQSKESALVLTIGDINDSRVVINPYQITGNITPVNSYTDGEYTQVQIMNVNDDSVTVSLYYKINQLSDEVLDNGLKYTIAKSNGLHGVYEEVQTGVFSDLNGKNEIFNEVIAANVYEYYRIYVWLDSSIANQTAVQGETINLELNGSVDLNGIAPVVNEGLIPVTIAEDGVVTTIDRLDTSWYNYPNKEWANAILVSSSSRSSYLGTSGVEVSTDDILAYYVWIPRYKYKLFTPNVSTEDWGDPEMIEIEFESASAPISSGTTIGSYRTHPAFWWDNNTDGVVDDGEMLSGIWVGKFETSTDISSTCYISESIDNCSNTDQSPRIVPNVRSLRYQTVSNQFKTALKFAGGTLLSGGTVFFEGNDLYGLTGSTDSHMMKNSEWGAVAYLSHSKYGAGSEIYGNNSSSYYTGRSGGVEPGDYLAQSYGSYTWLGQIVNSDGTIGEFDIYYYNYGPRASTTYNVTGIYDMSGGAYEYVMGNEGVIYSSGFDELPVSKYYNKYPFQGNAGSNIEYCTLDTCGGHALHETSGWYGDFAFFGKWLVRGGAAEHAYDEYRTGIFDSRDGNGSAYGNNSWRSVLLTVNNEMSGYVISYNANGGTGTPAAQMKTEGETLILTSQEPKKSGYYFAGWSEDPTATNATYGPGSSYTVNGSTTLYAVWKIAYAVYSADDTSLRFYGTTETINQGDSYNGKTVTAVYSDFTTIPWKEYKENITTVVVEDMIIPTSIVSWFSDMKNCTYLDLSKMDVSKVVDISSVFVNTGYNSTTFNIIGLDDWNVSNVKRMNGTFLYAGYNATNWSVGDLSKWDVSAVKDMSLMFMFSGYAATTWDIGNLNNWNTASVTDMSNMFHATGWYSTTWNVGDLSNWNTANVTNMSNMFSVTGSNVTAWSVGDLSGWNTANVTNMSSMFSFTGYNATNWSIGNLNNWNTSNVINMSSMFSNAGYNATNWDVGDLSGWNTANVTNMSSMFLDAGYTATGWSLDLSKWNVSNVTSYTDFATNVTDKIIVPNFG